MTPWTRAILNETLPRLQIRRDLGELLQRRLQIFDDLGGDHVGVGQVGGVLQALVLEPEDVQAELVALDAARRR